ncbi:gamma-glutamyltransferase [Marivibrio halodurans]
MNSGAPAEGVVTAAVDAAADAGAAMLAAGGNAFDAAVAAACAETVWLPMKCGLAGDVVALFSRAGGPTRALLSIGRGPLALGAGTRLARTGPLSVGGFGAPEGYARLAGLGQLPLDRLVAPAVAMARDGVRWVDQAVRLTAESRDLIARHNDVTPYLPGGGLPVPGEALRLPGLADLLERFGRTGGALFHGEAGDVVLAHLRGLGGMLQRDDLVRAVACEMPCARVDLPGGGILEVTPAPTHGPIHADALARVLSGAAEVEAIRAARAGFDARAGGGTSVVTAADGAGNRVVLVHSNSFPQYGSGVVVPEFDLILNNRPGRGFALDAPAGHWNAPDPLSVPATTLNAWHLGRREMDVWGGTPGGENQAVWNMQVTAALMGGHDPQQAIDLPKWRLTSDGGIAWEADHAARDPADEAVEARGLRSALQAIGIDRRTGAFTIGVDPRTGAAARFNPAR